MPLQFHVPIISVDLTVTDFCDLLSSLAIWTECTNVVAQCGFVDIDNDSDVDDSALLATLEPNVSHLVKLLFFIFDSFSDESYSKHDMFECCGYICSTKPTWNNFLSNSRRRTHFIFNVLLHLRSGSDRMDTYRDTLLYLFVKGAAHWTLDPIGAEQKVMIANQNQV